MKKTIVLNLIGGPGAGKSTFATTLFSMLKRKGVSCEYVDEFAKSLVWEGRSSALTDQLYILANQNHKLFQLLGKVNVIITDSPLPLSLYYNNHVGDEVKYTGELFDNFVLDCYNRYDNLLFYLEREFPYEQDGRVQSEKESNQVNVDLQNILKEKNVDFVKIKSNEYYAKKVVELVEKIVKIYSQSSEKQTELERRFLLDDDYAFDKNLKMNEIVQSYLNIGQTEKRVRKIDDKYFFTEKKGHGNKREEYEVEIDKNEYDYLLKNFQIGNSVLKNRYYLSLANQKVCELNHFVAPKKVNLVEVEFETEEEMKEFTPPDWFGKEVTDDEEYSSFTLAMA